MQILSTFVEHELDIMSSKDHDSSKFIRHITTINKTALIVLPGSNIPTHNTTAITIFNLEESTDWIAKFETYRKALDCPQCESKDVF